MIIAYWFYHLKGFNKTDYLRLYTLKHTYQKLKGSQYHFEDQTRLHDIYYPEEKAWKKFHMITVILVIGSKTMEHSLIIK